MLVCRFNILKQNKEQPFVQADHFKNKHFLKTKINKKQFSPKILNPLKNKWYSNFVVYTLLFQHLCNLCMQDKQKDINVNGKRSVQNVTGLVMLYKLTSTKYQYEHFFTYHIMTLGTYNVSNL